MKEKLGAALVCLVFALPFGGVGVFGTYMIYTMVTDGVRARDWVLVKAEVEDGNHYRYNFGGRSFRNDRLGTAPIGGSSDVDDFDERVAERYARAREEKKPMTVFVNPDNPEESMVDREIRWKLALVLMPFAFGFGGVGVGALWVLGKILFGKEGRGSAASAASRVGSDMGKGPLFIWVFAFFWNVISFPIAIVLVPQAIADGEYLALLVLLFPVIGVLLIAGAIGATIQHFRPGKGAEPRRAKKRERAAAPERPSPQPEPAEPVLAAAGGDFTKYAQPKATGMARSAVGAQKYESLEKILGGHVDVSKVTAGQREAFDRMTPQQKAAIAKVVEFAPRLKKLVIGLVVFIVGAQLIPALLDLFL